MNFFILDTNVERCARAHADVHVNKMCLEAAQMLCTAYRMLFGEKGAVRTPKKARIKYLLPQFGEFGWMRNVDRCEIYWDTHHNHPCSVWVRESSENYRWAYGLFAALATEYQYRFGREHRSWVRLADLLNIPVPFGPLTPFALAMPDEFKSDDAVAAYRAYYLSKRNDMNLAYTRRAPPQWLETSTEDYNDEN